MNLTEMTVKVRIELVEATESVFLDTEIARGVQKSVSLMSRLLPKRVVVEARLDRNITGETLTISSDTGTTSYKPLKEGTISIPNKSEHTNYYVNNLTGKVTEITSLDNADYIISYDLDPHLLDISSILPEEDYIKIEKIEYPVGVDPPSIVTFETYGEFLLIKSTLTSDTYLRIIYLKPWTAPTVSTAATLTTALGGTNDDLVFTARTGGAPGNSISIAYVDPVGNNQSLSIAVTVSAIVVNLATGVAGAITSTAATIKAAIDADSSAVVLVSVANASSNDGTGVVTAMGETALTGGSDSGVDGDYPEHLDNAIIIGTVGQVLIFKAEEYVQDAVSALSALTAPIDYSYSAATLASLPAVPTTTAPTAYTLSWTDVELALDEMFDLASAGELVTAAGYLTTGAAKITPINDADRVAQNYGLYASETTNIAMAYGQLAAAYHAEQLAALEKYSQEVAYYAADVNRYASTISGTVGKFEGDTAVQSAAIDNFTAKVQKYTAQTNEQAMKAQNFLAIAGRYLASGQAKINEMLVMMGLKAEYNFYRSSSEQFA